MSEEELDIKLKRIREFLKHEGKLSTPFRAETFIGNDPQVIPS